MQIKEVGNLSVLSSEVCFHCSERLNSVQDMEEEEGERVQFSTPLSALPVHIKVTKYVIIYLYLSVA